MMVPDLDVGQNQNHQSQHHSEPDTRPGRTTAVVEPDTDHGRLKFRYTRRMIWTLQLSAIGLCVYAIQAMGPAAAPVLTTTLPAMLGLAGAYAGITNKWGR